MACTLVGPHEWSMTQDELGHREYKITHMVVGTTADGPAQARLTPGLPLPGSYWAFGNDLDLWAFCKASSHVTPFYKKGSPGRHFLVEQTFSTKHKRVCADVKIEDPLLEPAKISEDYQSEKEEATHDMFNNPILTSSHEMLRGPQVEFPLNRKTIKIEQNVASYYEASVLPESMLNCVNDSQLWGRDARKILLLHTGMERKFYGQCNAYYTRRLEFLIDHRFHGHDRYLLDEGTKALHGRWDRTTGRWTLIDIAGSPPDSSDPKHFDQFKDRNGENCRVILDGYGQPSGANIGDDASYVRVDFAHALGLPLLDGAVFIAQVGGDQEFDLGEAVVRGNVRQDDDVLYIAVSDFTTALGPAFDPGNWTTLPNGINDVGVYDSVTDYDIGDRVTNPDADDLSLAGSVFVRKYRPANFLLLGIPLSF